MSFGPSRKAKSRRTPGAEPEPLTRAKLEQLALGYLNRFDASSQKLTQHLRSKVRKLAGPPEASVWISELIARYQSSGLLDDARFAKNLAAQLSTRGKSARVIAQKLSARGVPGQLTEEVMTTRRRDEPGAELEAALAYVRKRRLGPFRSAAEREQFRHKDLATLARQGFSFDTARKALAAGDSSDEEF